MDAGIKYSEQFQGYEACIAAGLDLWRWEQGLYTPQFRAKVMVWKDMHDLVEMHTNDAVAQKQDEESRRSK